MSATLTVVGSGTLLPDAERGSASHHLQVLGREGGHALLMDAGSGTLHSLARLGLDWRAIDTVAISHFHTDHVSDLPALLAAYRFEGAERPLTVAGPSGLRDFMERMAALYGRWILEPSRPLTIVELEEGRVWRARNDALRLAVAPTPHTGESIAFRVETGEGVVGYTGDTGPSERLSVFLGGCAVLVAECALEDPPEMDTHLSPASVAALGAAAGPELLVVTHVYPPRRPEDVVAEIAERYPGRVEAARDGTRIVLAGGGAALDVSPPEPRHP